MSPLILTLKIDKQSLKILNNLRQQHFPNHINFLSAHVTLFHALPGEHEFLIKKTLQDLALETSILKVSFPRLCFLGKGNAVEIECSEIIRIRKSLSIVWSEWLTKQDKHFINPHVTIQNKVTPDKAKHLFNSLAPIWSMADGYGEGFMLWRYLGGPWDFIAEFLFSHQK